MRRHSSVVFVSLLALAGSSGDALAGQAAKSASPTRDIKVISSAGARAMADACTAWAEQNKQVLAMAIIDWAGNLIEFHAMEGAPMNSIETAQLKAKSALRWRRPTSETNKIVRSGENLAATFMNDFPQPGALPWECRAPTERNARRRRSTRCSGNLSRNSPTRYSASRWCRRR
jgi:hypothetical protein